MSKKVMAGNTFGVGGNGVAASAGWQLRHRRGGVA
jgi:hypothetical protein